MIVLLIKVHHPWRPFVLAGRLHNMLSCSCVIQTIIADSCIIKDQPDYKWLISVKFSIKFADRVTVMSSTT